MESTSRSIEISLSRATARSAVMSMSTSLLVRLVVPLVDVRLKIGVLDAAELDLHHRRAHPVERQLAGVPLDVEPRAVRAALSDPTDQRGAVGQRRLDEAADGALPVPRL